MAPVLNLYPGLKAMNWFYINFEFCEIIIENRKMKKMFCLNAG